MTLRSGSAATGNLRRAGLRRELVQACRDRRPTCRSAWRRLALKLRGRLGELVRLGGAARGEGLGEEIEHHRPLLQRLGQRERETPCRRASRPAREVRRGIAGLQRRRRPASPGHKRAARAVAAIRFMIFSARFEMAEIISVTRLNAVSRPGDCVSLGVQPLHVGRRHDRLHRLRALGEPVGLRRRHRARTAGRRRASARHPSASSGL